MENIKLIAFNHVVVATALYENRSIVDTDTNIAIGITYTIRYVYSFLYYAFVRDPDFFLFCHRK